MNKILLLKHLVNTHGRPVLLLHQKISVSMLISAYSKILGGPQMQMTCTIFSLAALIAVHLIKKALRVKTRGVLLT